MATVLLIIHFFIAVFLVGSVLIQRSEGGALGGLGGGSGGMMTARGTANLLTRITGVLAAMFFASSLLIAIILRSPDGGSSILDVEDKPVIEQTVSSETAPAPEAEAVPTSEAEANQAPTAEEAPKE